MAEYNAKLHVKTNSGYDDINVATKASIVEFDNSTIGLKSNNVQKAIEEIPSLICKQNLLVNSNFKKGIINQKGESGYNGNISSSTAIYGYDMWSIGQYGKMTMQTGYMKFWTEQGGAYITQYIKEINPIGKTYTFTIKLKEEDSERKIVVENIQSGTKKNIFTDTNKDVYIEFNSSLGFLVCIYLKTKGSYINIEYMKVEEGKIYTGMPEWDGTLELIKCKKYFIAIKNIRIALRGHAGQTFAISFPLPVIMNKIPSVSIASTTGSQFVNSINSWVDNQILQMTWICDNDNMFNFNASVYLDAYFY